MTCITLRSLVQRSHHMHSVTDLSQHDEVIRTVRLLEGLLLQQPLPELGGSVAVLRKVDAALLVRPEALGVPDLPRVERNVEQFCRRGIRNSTRRVCESSMHLRNAGLRCQLDHTRAEDRSELSRAACTASAATLVVHSTTVARARFRTRRTQHEASRLEYTHLERHVMSPVVVQP